MKIGTVDLDRDVLVIAEIGNNHEGDPGLAEEMILAAASCGVDAVKFQRIVPEKLVAPSERARRQQLAQFRLSDTTFRHLHEVATSAGVLFLCTPFDLEGVAFLDPLVPAFKIASGDNNFIPLLQKASSTGKPLLLSTGVAASADIARSLAAIRGQNHASGRDHAVVLLHCVVSYPTSIDDANLGAIESLRMFGTPVGYSDHTLGVEACVLAVGIGARVLEKHFTLDKKHSSFRDHALSADPDEMKILVTRVREASRLIGSKTKTIGDAEQPNAVTVRRSICAARDLQSGTIVQWSDLVWLRPGTGMPPGQEAEVVGRRLIRPMSEGEAFAPEVLGPLQMLNGF